MMNKVARYRGIGTGNAITKEPGYIYANEDGIAIVDELKNVKQLCSKDYATGKAADAASMEARIAILEEKVNSLKKTSVSSETISDTAVSLTDSTKDYVVSGSTNTNGTITGKSIELTGFEMAVSANTSLASSGNNAMLLTSSDIELKSSNLSMDTTASSNCVKAMTVSSNARSSLPVNR